MNTNTPNKPAPAIAPFPYSVTLPDGTVERFIIKPLPITQLYQWLYLAKDQSEPAMVALAVNRSLDWVDSLDVDVYARLAGKCSELLFPQAARLAKHAPAAASLLAQVMRWQAVGMQAIAILSTGSGELSPKPPGSESAPETVSESPTPTVSTDSVKSSQPADDASPRIN